MTRRRPGPYQGPRVSAAKIAAHTALLGLITHHVEQNRDIPCLDPLTGPAWTSESPSTQQATAAACGPCPVLKACRVYAQRFHEAGGVWGGQVRSTGGTKTGGHNQDSGNTGSTQKGVPPKHRERNEGRNG